MTEKVVYAEHTERAVVVKSAYVTIIWRPFLSCA